MGNDLGAGGGLHPAGQRAYRIDDCVSADLGCLGNRTRSETGYIGEQRAGHRIDESGVSRAAPVALVG